MCISQWYICIWFYSFCLMLNGSIWILIFLSKFSMIKSFQTASMHICLYVFLRENCFYIWKVLYSPSSSFHKQFKRRWLSNHIHYNTLEFLSCFIHFSENVLSICTANDSTIKCYHLMWIIFWKHGKISKLHLFLL